MCRPAKRSSKDDDSKPPNAESIRLATYAFVLAGLTIPTVILSRQANQPPVVSIFGNQADNKCDQSQLMFDNVDCVHTPGPQAGANVTKGYVGGVSAYSWFRSCDVDLQNAH